MDAACAQKREQGVKVKKSKMGKNRGRGRRMHNVHGGQIHPGAPRMEEAETPFSLFHCLHWDEGAGAILKSNRIAKQS